MTERALLVRATFSASGRYSAAAIEHASARVFDTTTGDLVATAAATDYTSTQITALDCFVASGRVAPTVVMGTESGRVCVFDTATQTMVAETLLTEAGVPVAGLRHVEGSTSFLALAVTGVASIFDGATGACVASKLKTPITRASTLDAVMVGRRHCVAVIGAAAMCASIDVPLDGAPDGAKCETRCLFTGHAAPPSKMVLFADGNGALSSTNSDGIIRLWDLRPASSSSAPGAPANAPSDRCRRTMIAGHRMLDFAARTVQDTTFIAATTITGEVVLWRFNAVAFAADSRNHIVPVAPFARLASAVAPGRLLAASFNPDAALVVARGRWATPAFEVISNDVVAEANKTMSRGSAAAQVFRVPFVDAADTKNSSINIVPNKRKNARDPKLALTTEVQATAATSVSVPLAKSLDELPVAIKAAAAADDASSVGAATTGSATGVLIPLHQALHAKDEGLATELIMVAARTDADVAVTVAGLQLPYLVELLRILSRRVLTAGLGSPAHGWLNAILTQRGAELAAVAKNPDDALSGTIRSVLGPVLAHYRQVAALQDSVSLLYGRSSIFKSTRVARGKATFLNNFEEPRRAGATRFVRMSALGDGTLAPDAEDDAEGALSSGRPTRRGRRATKNARQARMRIAAKEALLADGADGADSDDADAAILEGGRGGGKRLRGLDDGSEGDDNGDDGSEAMGDDDDYEEGEEDDDFDDEEGDESLDDEDLDDLDDGDDDDIGGSGAPGEHGEDEEGSVEYESGASVDDDDDVDGAGFTATARANERRKHGRLNVDGDGDEDEEDD